MKIEQKSLKLTSFPQQLKLSDANIVFYDVQHKHLCQNLRKSSLGFYDPLSPRVGCPICHFSVQKGARDRPLCGHYAPSMRTSAEPASLRATQPTSTRQSKQHYVMKVQTLRKTARV